MPQAVAAVVYAFEATITFISAEIGGAVAGITGSTAAGAAVSDVVYASLAALPRLAVYAGLSALLAPKIPKPDAALLTLKQSVPQRRRAFGVVRTGGPFFFWKALGDKSYDGVIVHDGQINQYLNFYLNDELATLVGDVVQTGADGRYTSPQVRIQSRVGLPTETPYADLVSAFPTIWDNSHRGDNTASVLLICQNGKAVHFNHDFPNGKPAVSAEYESQLVFDPRNVAHDEADPSTWDFVGGRNVILQLLTYLMRERGYAYDWDAEENDTFNADKWNRRFGNNLALWAAAADVCDEEVDLAAGGTEPRYRAGFQYLLDQPESAVVNVLLVACDGWLGLDGNGGFVPYAGKFSPPTRVLTDADVKAFSCERGVAVENQVNQINATFTDPAKSYNSAEVDPWIDPVAVARAGTPLVEQLDLPQVQSFTQCRRLMKRRMERHQALARGQMTVEFNTDTGKSVLGQRYLQVSLAQGPTVMADMIIEVTDTPTIDLSNWTISFPWTSVDPNARDGWTPETDEGATPPPGDTTPPELLAIPTIDTISASYGTDPTPRLALNVTGADRSDMTWQLQWRRQGTTLWTVEDVDDADVYPSPVLISGFVPADAVLEVQVQYTSGGGNLSGWSLTSTVDTSAAYPTADSTTITADSTIITADATP